MTFPALHLLAGEQALAIPRTLELGNYHRLIELRDGAEDLADQLLKRSRPVLLRSTPPTNALWISSTTGRRMTGQLSLPRFWRPRHPSPGTATPSWSRARAAAGQRPGVDASDAGD